MLRNWNRVPTGRVSDSPGRSSVSVARPANSRHIFPRPLEDVPDLLDRPVHDGAGHLVRAELEVRRARAVEPAEDPNARAVGRVVVPVAR